MRTHLVWMILPLIAATAAAQVPAPDFVVDAPILSLSSFSIGLHAQGPPGSPYIILGTLDDPYIPQALNVFTISQGNLPLAGQVTTTIQVPNYQGIIPDVWFGCIMIPPNQQPVVAGIAGAGFFFPAAPLAVGLADLAATMVYDRDSGNVNVRVVVAGGAGQQVTLWWTNNCPQLGQQPPLGGFNFIGAGVLGPNGAVNFVGNQPNLPPGACLVLTINVGGNPTVIGVRHV